MEYQGPLFTPQDPLPNLKAPLITPSAAPSSIRKDQYEKAAWAQNRVICGVDEVGRGCLAGPLVTAAVILHPGRTARHLKDSKLMSPEELAYSARWVLENSWYGYGMVTHTKIDQCNIYQATLLAMRRAVIQAILAASECPTAILVDAMPLTLPLSGFQEIPIHHFPKAESKSSSVAAASIIAKVKRDALMQRLDGTFPGYHLAAHKGYATASHCTAVQSLGPSIIHRKSFLDKVLQPAEQLSLVQIATVEQI